MDEKALIESVAHLDDNIGRLAAHIAGIRLSMEALIGRLDRLDTRIEDLGSELHHLGPASDTQLQSLVVEVQLLRRDIGVERAKLSETLFEVMK